MNVKLSKLSLYPLLQLICFLPLGVSTFVKAQHHGLWIILTYLYSSNGILNTLVFIYVRNIKTGEQEGAVNDKKDEIENEI